jgi:hypothetical protein
MHDVTRYPHSRRSGGIGRRTGFKNLWSRSAREERLAQSDPRDVRNSRRDQSLSREVASDRKHTGKAHLTRLGASFVATFVATRVAKAVATPEGLLHLSLGLVLLCAIFAPGGAR